MKLSQIWQIKVLRRFNNTRFDEEHLYFFLTLITGVISGLMAVFINDSVHWLGKVIGTHQPFTIRTTILAGLAVFISGVITTRYSSWTAGSGIPQVKLALVVHQGRIAFKDWFLKIITSILSLSSGLSLGREGPTVSITAGIGSSLGSFFSLSKRKIKGLVAVGAAGGIAAAFNTPIAGVIFTLEEIVGDLNTKMLGSIVISSVIAAVTATAIHGDNPTFVAVHYTLRDHRELLVYLLLGTIAAFIGPMWSTLVIKMRGAERKIFKQHKLTVIMIVFFIVAAVSNLNTEVVGAGPEIIKKLLLSEYINWKVILILFVLKFILTALCYSTGVSGGLFFPTLFIGASLGALVGSLAHTFLTWQSADIGAYALVGMGAFFAAVIRAPFTSIVMIFEMTHDYKIILPLMVSNIVAYALSAKISEGSIYEQISEQDGVHLPTRDDDEILDSLQVEDAMVKDVQTLNYNLTIREALKIVNHSEISGYPVMKNGLIFGVISTNELGAAWAKFQGSCTLDLICCKDLVWIYPDQSLMTAFHKLKQHSISRLLVVSRINDKKLVGIITAEDIVKKFGYTIAQESKADVIDKYMQEVEEKYPVS